MRKPFWARLLILSVLFALIPVARPAVAAADTVVNLLSFTYPSSVVAGSQAVFTVSAKASTPTGVCCGTVTVKDPQDHTFSVRLERTGGSNYKGTLDLSPNAIPGRYTVTAVRLQANDAKVTTLDSTTPGFSHAFTVNASGQPVDTVGPELISLNATAQVEMGEIVTVTAKAKDNLSGIQIVTVWIEPVAEQATTQKPWRQWLDLFPTGQPDEFAGNMPMDALASPGRQRVVKVALRDKAGNITELEGDKLTTNRAYVTDTFAKTRKVPEGLITQPTLQVIHPGSISFWNWLEADREYARQLLWQSRTDVTAVREKITGELPQLQAAMEALRKEIYVDPATGLKVSPYATSGKWMVLETAMNVRQELLLELERREGKLDAERTELTDEDVYGYYLYTLEQGEAWIPVGGSLNETLSQYPAAVLALLARSPEAVKTMKTPSHENFYASFTQRDRDVIYFMPVFSNDITNLMFGTSIFEIKVNPAGHLRSMIHDLFYKIGAHFGQAYFSDYYDEERLSKWDAYLKLRNANEWTDDTGYMGWPDNNIGDDFAYTFLPANLGQQYYSVQSYPRLRENAAMLDGFKKLVQEKLAKPFAVTTITPGAFVTTGVSAFKVTVNPGATVLQADGIGRYWGASSSDKPMTRSTNGQQAVLTGDDATVGQTTAYLLAASDSDQRIYLRYMTYYRVPVALDPVPVAVNKPSVKVSGTAPANATVTLNSVTATAGANGRFEATVPLAVGDNSIRITVPGVQLGARVKVQYEPEGTKIPLKVTLPGSSSKKVIEGAVETVPFATVTVGALKGQADAQGRATIFYVTNEGVNKVEVTATSPAGNKVTWSGTVVVDSLPPVITVSVPMRTNLPVYKVAGKVDPGSTLTMGESVVNVQSDGSFAVDVNLEENKPRELEFTATDAAGNRVSTKATITYVADVPAVTRSATVEINGKVRPGVELTYNGKPVDVNMYGSFSLRVPSPAGRNVYVLNATFGGAPAGFIQYVVVNPLQVNFPTALEDGTVKVTGKTVPGYIVIVDGRSVTVEADGTWTAVVARNDRTAVEVLAQGDGQTYKETITLP